jgi:hypothetical protein
MYKFSQKNINFAKYRGLTKKMIGFAKKRRFNQ